MGVANFKFSTKRSSAIFRRKSRKVMPIAYALSSSGPASARVTDLTTDRDSQRQMQLAGTVTDGRDDASIVSYDCFQSQIPKLGDNKSAPTSLRQLSSPFSPAIPDSPFISAGQELPTGTDAGEISVLPSEPTTAVQEEEGEKAKEQKEMGRGRELEAEKKDKEVSVEEEISELFMNIPWSVYESHAVPKQNLFQVAMESPVYTCPVVSEAKKRKRRWESYVYSPNPTTRLTTQLWMFFTCY